MTIEPLAIAGAYRIWPDPRSDERGWFARAFCGETLAARGAPFSICQSSLSYTRAPGTLRGMHWQESPWSEAKIVRCLTGAIYDVLADIRPDSPTSRIWTAVELSEPGDAVVVPEGVAHGFLTLTPGCLIHYDMSAQYRPAAGRGLRWDDPSFGIQWPFAPKIISEQDRRWPDWAPEPHGER